MTTYNTVFADVQYREIAKKAANYFQELAVMACVPALYTELPDALYYRHLKLSKSKASEGIGDDWSPQGPKADTEHGYDDYYLGGKEMHLHVPKKNINHYTDKNLLADKRAAEIKKFALDVDEMYIYGNYRDINDRDAYIDGGGLINQGTLATNLNGTDSNLATKGDIWKAIDTMMNAIPFRMRKHGPSMVLIGSENVMRKARQPDRIYQDKVEWNFIHDTFSGPEALIGNRIGQYVVTNKILVDGTDTKGTHDRLILFVPDQDILARCISRSFSLLDEEKIMFNIHQAWGVRASLNVFEAEGSQRSEQIVWA